MSRKERPDYSIGTKMAHLGRNVEEQCGFVNTPIYRGSTVVFKSVDDLENHRARWVYGRYGTPTIASLEEAWSSLSGAAGTVLTPSGLGAICIALLTTLKAGDHLLMVDSAYGPARAFCNGFLKKIGVTTEYYDPLVGANIEALIRPNTTTIFLESPGSQTFEVQDVPAITAVAKKHGVKTVIDNTWATPLFFTAHEHGCDLSVEAGTKYLGGHSDLLMGLVSANEEMWPILRKTFDHMGMQPGNEDCFLALRGLRTMHLRVKEAERRGLELAQWFTERPEIAKVLHPAFSDCPGHEFWKRDFTGSTGLFSVILDKRYSKKGLASMLDTLNLFALGYSWGGFESLVTPFDCASYRTVTSWESGTLAIRIQVGLEDMDDLKNDLDAGFARLKRDG